MKAVPIENGISIVPETDFEAELLVKMFVGSGERSVVVKSGMSLSDIVSVDVKAKEKDLAQYASNSLKNLVRE